MDKLPEYPRLSEHLLADVAVIGGGMAGLLTAFSLHRAGLRVVLLEENRLAGGATGRCTARLSAQHGLFCERLIRDFGEHLARQYVMAQLHAVKQYRDLVAALGVDCGWREQTSRVCTAPNGPDTAMAGSFSFPTLGLYTSAASVMPKRFLNVALACSTLSDFRNVLSHVWTSSTPSAATAIAIANPPINDLFIIAPCCLVSLLSASSASPLRRVRTRHLRV